MASLSPSPVMLLTPVLGEAATTSWPRWRRMGTVFEPIRPVPPRATIFIPNLLVRSPQAGVCGGCTASNPQQLSSTNEGRLRASFPHQHPPGAKFRCTRVLALSERQPDAIGAFTRGLNRIDQVSLRRDAGF